MIARRALLAAPLAAAAGWAILGHAAPDDTAIRRRADAIGSRFGIRIGTGDPATFFTPPYGPQDAVIEGGVATAVRLGDLPRALDGIEASLSLYPPGFYARLCQAIFFAGSLMLDGASAGGTYGRAWLILVANQAKGADGIYETARLGAHHEFSSLVWTRLPDLPGTWSRLLPADWAPATDTAQALTASDRGSPLASDGFLSPYGATTAENDFNVYAETLFPDPGRILTLSRAVPLVARKAALLMSAYARIDPAITATFRSMGLGPLMTGDPWRSEFSTAPANTPTPVLVR